MDIKTLQKTPPWDWPADTGMKLQQILPDRRANPSDRLIAAELAGDLTVINDELAGSLLTIVRTPDEPEQLRAKAAISLGPVLEQADIDGFDDPDAVPITERAFRNIRESLQKFYLRRQYSQGSPAEDSGGFGPRSRRLAPERGSDCVCHRRPGLDTDGSVFDELGSRF